MNKQNVLIIDNFLSRATGYRWFCEDLSEQLEKQGWKVYRTSCFLNKFKRIFDMIRTTWKQRKKYDIALIGVYSGYSFIWATLVLLLLKILDKKSWIHIHGGRFDEFSDRYFNIPIRICNMASYLSSPSQRLCERFSSYLHKPIQTLRNGVSLLNKELPHSRIAFDYRKICWLRAFENTYNPIMAIKAIEMLKNEYKDIHLDLCGRIKDQIIYNNCQKYVKEHDLQENITIIPGIMKNEVPNFLAQHDIFINTTNYESFGVSVVEAAASGMVMILTDAGELPYLWKDGETAFFVPKGDEKELANKIRIVLNERRCAAVIARNSQQYALMFSWDNCIEEWINTFMKVKNM